MSIESKGRDSETSLPPQQIASDILVCEYCHKPSEGERPNPGYNQPNYVWYFDNENAGDYGLADPMIPYGAYHQRCHLLKWKEMTPEEDAENVAAEARKYATTKGENNMPEYREDRLETEDPYVAQRLQPGFSPSQSPTPAPKPEPDNPTGEWFGDVIEDLLDGHKVRRLSWPEGECVFFGTAYSRPEGGAEDGSNDVPFEALFIRRNGTDRLWTIGRVDLENADDWVVVE